MVTRDRSTVRLTLATALTILLAVWVGGSVIVDGIVVPLALDELPRVRFAEFGALLFHRMNFLEAILGAIAVLISFSLGRRGWGTIKRQATATGILLGMTALVLIFLLWMTPTMLSKVTELRHMGVNLSDPGDMPPARRAFRLFHSVYAFLDVAKICAGAVVLWLLAVRRGR